LASEVVTWIYAAIQQEIADLDISVTLLEHLARDFLFVIDLLRFMAKVVLCSFYRLLLIIVEA